MSSPTNQLRSSPRVAAMRRGLRSTTAVRPNVMRTSSSRATSSSASLAMSTAIRAQSRGSSTAATSTASDSLRTRRISTMAAITQRSSGTAAISHGVASSRIRSRAVATSAAGRTSTAATHTTTAASRASTGLISESRVNTRRSASSRLSQNLEEKASPPDVELSVVSPFSKTTNQLVQNARRMSLSTTVIYCPICLLNVKKENKHVLSTLCGHIFCDNCLTEAHRIRPYCPICQQIIRSSDFRELFY